jgi:predicted PurR-regulated permease PerM
LWVAFADLIPLVGATLGAVVAVIAALLVSPSAGIIAGVFFLVYQQFENSVLQVVVMARTVRVSSLMVLLSVLVGAELFGVVGAVLALPAAGAGSVVVKELWRHRSRTDGLLVVGRVDRDGDAPAPPRHRVVEWTRRLRSRPAGPASPDRQE